MDRFSRQQRPDDPLPWPPDLPKLDLSDEPTPADLAQLEQLKARLQRRAEREREQEELSRVAIRMLREARTANDLRAVQEKPAAIVWLGDCVFLIPGQRPLSVGAEEQAVLTAFLRSPVLSERQLVDVTGYQNPVKTLRALKVKYKGSFSPYIELPGGKGRGGYHVKIVKAWPKNSDA